MLKKSYLKTRNACRVTFELPGVVNAASAHLAGDFNNWDRASHPMKKRKKDGAFTITIDLPRDQIFHFRYWLDNSRWENDWAADAYVPGPFGEDNSVVYT
jgi:1,4-alpha-glucan branching enzyme